MTKPEPPTMAFYGSISQVSFGSENEVWRKALPRMGFRVQEHERTEPLNRGDPANMLWVHTAYTEGQLTGTGGLHDLYDVVVGKDVLNYSQPGPLAERHLGSGAWDVLAFPYVPKSVVRRPGGPKIISWPRPLAPEICTPPRPIKRAVPRLLLSMENSCWERKGHDLHRQVLLELQHRGLKFETVLKTRYGQRALTYLRDVRRKILLQHYTDIYTMRTIYDSCDILLHLHRGGAQEMVPLEAMARGLVTVVPDAAPTSLFTEGGPAHKIGVTVWNPPEGFIDKTTGGCDAGVGYEADVFEAADRLESILENLKEERRKALEWAPKFQAMYGVDATLGRIRKELADAVPNLRSLFSQN